MRRLRLGLRHICLWQTSNKRGTLHDIIFLASHVLLSRPGLKGMEEKLNNQNLLSEIISRQVLPTFRMIEQILDSITPTVFESKIKDYSVRKLIYHPIYWIDYHLSFGNFEAPDFHVEGYNVIEKEDDFSISISELKQYANDVESRVMKNLQEFEILSEFKPGITVLDKITGQIRHSCYHIGVVHLLIYQETGNWLDYIGPVFK
jgi:hypothetical protein